MSREKLKAFLVDYYEGAIPEQRIGITIDPTDVGPTDRFNHGDDLGIDPATGQELVGLQNPQTTGGLIGDFLAYMIELTDNAYKLDGGNTLAVSLNSRMGNSSKGVPLEAADNQGAAEVFVEGSESARNTLGSVMALYSNGYFPTQDLQNIISKDNTNTELSGKYTQELLSNIEGEDLNSTGKTFGGSSAGLVGQGAPFVKKSAQQILIDRSRFSPGLGEGEGGAAFAPYPTDQSSFESGDNDAGTTTSQNAFGDYDLDAVKIIEDELKSVGASLLLKSAGWDKGDSPAESSDPSGFTFSEDSSAWEEGVYTKISPSVLRSREAFNAPQDDLGDSTRSGRGAWGTLVTDEDTDFVKSFGTMTTPETQFSNEKNKDILVAHAAAAISAMIILTKSTWELVDTGVEAMIDLERGPYYKGEPKVIAYEAKFALLRKLVLIPTQNPYTDCVERGFKVLFGTGNTAAPANIESYQQIQEAPGFWLGVARKIIRGFKSAETRGGELLQNFESDMKSGISTVLAILQTNDIINIMNVAATVGDVSITTAPGWDGDAATKLPPVGQWNVDRLPDGPATRVSKSRSQSGLTSNSLAWRGNAVPALYMIPKNVIMAATKMGSLAFGQNPAKGHLGTELAKNTYIDVSAEGPSARIPNDIVERMENLLDSEYVPFYFHDLRTNEIVSFHAFLDNLSDSYQPQFTKTNGYGRIDPVQIYRSTTRSIRFSFYVAATSKEDFNDMWFKINKLTSLVYPQWSEGTKLATMAGEEESTFIMPFSQVLASSPVIRLRVGDVIKGNYSKFNLARIFGVGNTNIAPVADATSGIPGLSSLINAPDMDDIQMKTVFNALYGSPLSWFAAVEAGADPALTRGLRAAGSQLLANGFANPLGLMMIMRELQDPDARINSVPFSITAAGAVQALASGLRNVASPIMGYTPLSFPYLRPSVDNGYKMDATGVKWRITRPIRVMVLSRDIKTINERRPHNVNESSAFKGPGQPGSQTQKTYYNIIIMDFNAPAQIFGRKFQVTHADLMPNPDTLFNTYVLATLSLTGVVDALVQTLANEAATISGIPADVLDVASPDAATFMKSQFNPIVKSFESTAGRGLAGVISSLSYEWIDGTNTWEVDWNSRAPKYAKVSINFDAIHDIPPGLDYSGYNRAPLYNVGDTMQKIAGDPYADDGRASHDAYKNQGRLGAQANDPDEDGGL